MKKFCDRMILYHLCIVNKHTIQYNTMDFTVRVFRRNVMSQTFLEMSAYLILDLVHPIFIVRATIQNCTWVR